MWQELHDASPGSAVEARGDRWRVIDVDRYDDCAVCRVLGTTASNRGVERSLLLPFDRLRPGNRPARLRRIGRRRWMLALRALSVDFEARGGLRGAAFARLTLIDYQLEPALACARGATRVLIADEVGLGKTIEAGLILGDIWARTSSPRALVAAPAGLCQQWVEELQDRFRLPAVLVDAGELRRASRLAAPDDSVWARIPLAVVSIDFVKQPEVLHGLAAVRWDLLVVDEAHLAAMARERAAAVRWLARRARRVVLLTATPHPGEPGAFEALAEIGRLPADQPMVMFRRTRLDLGFTNARHVRILSVRLSPVETRMHALLHRYCSKVWRETDGQGANPDARLAMIVLGKRASSGAASLAISLDRRLQALSSGPDAAGWQPSLPLAAEDEDCSTADEDPTSVLAAPGLSDRQAEKRMLQRLLDLAREAVRSDSKERRLGRLLLRITEPAVVFTEYRDTLERLARVLSEHASLAVLHGGLDARARNDAVRAFAEGRVRVLLATDAAAHGLNLHTRCRLVVNLELPWNPVRLEQRIGRVDRIGQSRTVHAVHLVAAGTSEEQVLARLVVRLHRAREVLGTASSPLGHLTEFQVGEHVMTGAGTPPDRLDVGETSTVRSPFADRAASAHGGVRRLDLRVEARAEVARLKQVRELARGPRPEPSRVSDLEGVLSDLGPSGAWWTVLRRRDFVAGLLPCVLCLHRVQVVDGAGRIAERLLVPIRIDVPIDALRTVAVNRGALRALLDAARDTLSAAARAWVERYLDAGRESLRLAVAPLCARQIEIARVADATPVVALQPGLFDRRALKSADRDEALRRRSETDDDARLSALTRATDLSLAGPPAVLLVAVVT
ncbi:MAG TPA: helicase-related protein [Vicinamibacterales bacterium]|jgi:superfamily II DNA or RNA helicase